MINERLFGSPISGKVRKKLEDRQRVAGEVAFGDSIEAVYPDKDGQNQADLSSRTPFIRMWTSVKLVEQAKVEEVLEEAEGETTLDAYYLSGDRLDELRKTHPLARITEIDGKIYITDGFERPQTDYSSKLYIVGDYNYQTAYGSVDTNESLQNPESNTETSSDENYLSGELFPQELQNNPLLKPQAGITSMTSETEGTLGVIKRSVVNFVVHNFEDFDKIYNRYFLKPGATVFVDFGHSSVKNLYNPNDLINAPDIKKFLYESNVIPGYEESVPGETLAEGESVEETTENIGEIAKYQGDLEVLQGIVVDYNAKILTNGSVECSVTLVSSNTALLDFQIDDSMKLHISDVLVRSTQFLGLQSTLNNVTTYDQWDAEGNVVSGQTSDKQQARYATPNEDSSAEDIQKYNERVELETIKALSGKNLTPKSNEVRTGVYINSLDADDIYVSWGFIEDIIFNANFGFGNNNDDINQGNKFQVRMDSSNAFTTWNKIFKDRQQALATVPEEPPVFIYPEWWGDSDPDPGGYEDSIFEESVAIFGSYSYHNDKYPKIHYSNQEALGEHTSFDEEKARIPIREVFINMETITKAFTRNKTVRNTLNDILSDINNDSDGVFDWKVILGETDSELIIVDNNRPDINQRILDSGVVGTQEELEQSEREQFQNMFTFNVMSPNSIIKDYNLEFKLPQGNIGNMYAVQGMSHENKVFPTSDMVDNAIAINSLDDDSLSIIYQPDNGGYRNNQIDSKGNKDGEFFDVYASAKYLVDNNIYKTSAIRRTDDILDAQGFLENTTIQTSKNQKTLKEKQEDLIKVNIELLILNGKKVTKSFKDYYRLREIEEVSLKTKPNLLPYTLSLTTYGIGSIQPGDTFRVDYLPKQHFKNTFLQTMKVTNNINSDGWYTSLDTQYRILSDKKQKNYITDDEREKIFLSPKVLPTLGIKTRLYQLGSNVWIDLNYEEQYITIEDIIPYMSYLKPYSPPNSYNYVSLILEFKTTQKLSENLESYPIYPLYDYLIKKPNDVILPNVAKAFPDTSNWEAHNKKFIDTSTNAFVYRPSPIRIKPEQTYYIVIQGTECYITNLEGLSNDQFKYFDKPLSTLKEYITPRGEDDTSFIIG